MKKLSKSILVSFIAITILLINSCSLERRYHRNGFNVKWNHISLRTKNDKNLSTSNYEIENNINTSEKSKEGQCSNYESLNESNLSSSNDNIIVLNENKTYENSSVLNEVKDQWKSSRLTIENNPKNDDGSAERFESINKNDLKKHSKISKKPIENDEKEYSWTAAILLCFFLGVLGIHRFYLGHIGMGVLYLLTGGLCGIGALIDFILLLTGGLKPKNGKFKDDDSGL
jgi:TM2 domain-containing membrane protein YozV